MKNQSFHGTASAQEARNHKTLAKCIHIQYKMASILFLNNRVSRKPCL